MRFATLRSLLLSFVIAIPFRAAAAAPPAIDAEARSKIVAATIREIRARYVFPEVAARIDETLSKKARGGAYDAATTAPALAAAVTADLLAVSHDKHLRLLFEPRTPEAAAAPRAERVERFVRMLRGKNFGVARVERMPGNVGYLDLRTFESPEYAGPTIVAAMNLLAYTDALVIDLRKNTGGDGAMVTFLASFFFDGSEPTRLSDLYQREGSWSQQSWTTTWVPGAKFGGTKPVYILTGKTTFSAAEGFTYDLQSLKRATIVGEQTGGGANAGDEYRIDPLFTVWIPTSRAVNPVTHTNWEGVGVTPDVKGPEADALDTAYRLALAKLGKPFPPASSEEEE